MPLFIETPRLRLRSLKDTDLPRMVDLIGEWEVTQWLVHVPYPYVLRNAMQFYARMAEYSQRGAEECFVVAGKNDDRLMGVIGLHPAREGPGNDEIILGYWMGKPYWGQGFMTEAVRNIIPYAFRQPGIKMVSSMTDPANQASQKVLGKAGFTYLGIRPDTSRPEGAEVTLWRLNRPADSDAA